MSRLPLRISALYQRDLRSRRVFAEEFAALRRSSVFICISSVLSIRSNRKGMHI
jgi:hypothetical protein